MRFLIMAWLLSRLLVLGVVATASAHPPIAVGTGLFARFAPIAYDWRR